MEISSIWEGLKFTIVAVLIVFGVLAFLGFVLEMFRLIFYHPKKETPPTVSVKKEEVKIAPTPPVEKKEERRKRLKKIAAIAAVLSLYKERKEGYKKPLEGEINFWRVKGILGREVYSKIKTKRWKNG